MIAEELQGDQFPVRAKDKENMAPLSSDDPNVRRGSIFVWFWACCNMLRCMLCELELL